MNRLVIIGNGFDLAHGLKTSYKDFMEFIKSDIDKSESKLHPNPNRHINYKYKEEIFGIDNHHIALLKNEKTQNFEFSVPQDILNKDDSKYFRTLFEKYNKTNNWCDLEQLYYDILKEYMTKQPHLIDLINKEFDFLKILLESYLENEIEKKIENPDILNNNNILIKRDDKDGKLIAVVNFNYTKKIINILVEKYKENARIDSKNQISPQFKIINIHGEFSNKENPIIFGYGDDNTEEYKAIQDSKNDELLKNFKTFQYLRNSNYQSVLAILAADKDIIVEIIGHSCGLTDRTLLKTIFEHPNVKKIEYLYHEDESNYFKNLYSLSRIFTSNELFREKVKSLADTRNMTETIVKI